MAVLDTGIYPHEDFGQRITAFFDVLHRRREPYDDNGHGTHISAIIGDIGLHCHGDSLTLSLRDLGGENGVQRDIAGFQKRIHIDAKGGGFASDVLMGLRWIREYKDALGIRIVNISVGSYSRKNMSENSALVRGVDAAWDDGLVVVVAAGNNGPGYMTVTTPGISRKVITVGCSDDHKEVSVMGNRLVDYSGRGPTGACICKPEIVAPGAGIISCINEPGRYAVKSGTSMSTPVVAGAIALLLEKYPDMSNRDVKLRLRERAVDMGLPRNQQGWGLLDVERLLAD